MSKLFRMRIAECQITDVKQSEIANPKSEIIFR